MCYNYKGIKWERAQIYGLLIGFSSPFGNSRIDHFTDLLHGDITHIDKICDYVGQKIKCLCKPIGCEAHEGAE